MTVERPTPGCSWAFCSTVAVMLAVGGLMPFVETSVAAAKEKSGIAADYPEDEGIERDRRVLFAEDFETGTPEQIGARWGRISRKENASLSGDVHAGSPGDKSIHFRDNAYLFTHTKGIDTMYARFYVKFHEKTGYVHHFVHLVADSDPRPWPKGGAGETPAGDAKFSTGIEPTGRWGKFPPPGVWNFYTYWHEMKTKWGTVFNGKQEPILPGRWYCVEVMLKANSSPDKADGEQAFWVDGELCGRFTDFRWRTTDQLKINTFWLLYYNTDQPARHNRDPRPQERVMEVWFDDIVIATEYIGPVQSKPKPGRKKSRAEDTQSPALPPELPSGKSVVTISSPDLLKPPPSLHDVPVAKTPPVVDFLYYPGQTYKGNPWSNWGDGVAVAGKYYSAIGDHKAPDGNAYVYEYDAASKSLKRIVDLRQLLDVPDGQYTPGKIHGRLDIGRDGRLYFSTHRGSTRVTTDEYGYKGDWIIRHNPKTSASEIVAHGPVGKNCMPCSVLDPDRLIFYGGTAAGDTSDKRNLFFAFDTVNRKLLYSGYGGPGRYMVFAKSTGRAYFTPDLEGSLFRYDPEKGGPPVKLDQEIGIRAATQETPQGYVYTVSKGDAQIYRFDTRTEKVQPIGSAPIGTQNYITTIDADPTGRYLYYVPGAHGGSQKDGCAIIQFDVKKKTRKVIAFLHPFLKQQTGYTPLGTFSTAVGPAGDKLYITWNGNLGGTRRGRPTWDACALTVVHIPPPERLP